MNMKTVVWYGGIIVMLVSAFITPYNILGLLGVVVGLAMMLSRRFWK